MKDREVSKCRKKIFIQINVDKNTENSRIRTGTTKTSRTTHEQNHTRTVTHKKHIRRQ